MGTGAGAMAEVDPETMRTDFKRYRKGGIDELLRMSDVGREALLDEPQLREVAVPALASGFPAGMTNICVVPAGMTDREKTWSVPEVSPQNLTPHQLLGDVVLIEPGHQRRQARHCIDFKGKV